MQTFSSTVISVFAVLILSVIALLYRGKHEAFMGTTGDPELDQAGAIAGTIFTAVFVYLVSYQSIKDRVIWSLTERLIGLCGVLRLPGHAARAREPTRSDRVINDKASRADERRISLGSCIGVIRSI